MLRRISSHKQALRFIRRYGKHKILSVFDQDRAIYTYYIVPKDRELTMLGDVPKEPSRLGEAAFLLIPGLPKDAKKVGYGPVAIGSIVRRSSDV